MTPISSHTLLLVEDSEDDVILFQRTLKKSGLKVNFVHVEDGQQAVDYLAGAGEFSDRVRFPKPTVVLLDLKLPHRSGHEVLEWARSRPEWDTVCFVMLTSSSEPADVEKAYALGANAYFKKALATETLLELFAQIDANWARNGPRTRLDIIKSERPPSRVQTPAERRGRV